MSSPVAMYRFPLLSRVSGPVVCEFVCPSPRNVRVVSSRFSLATFTLPPALVSRNRFGLLLRLLGMQQIEPASNFELWASLSRPAAWLSSPASTARSCTLATLNVLLVDDFLLAGALDEEGPLARRHHTRSLLGSCDVAVVLQRAAAREKRSG